jgi:N4-gp56 family major capsid protein
MTATSVSLIGTAYRTTVNTLSPAVKDRYYNKLFLAVAEKKLIHKQLGQINKKIEQGEGGYGTGVLHWTRWTNLALVTAGQGEGIPTTAVGLSATWVTGTTAQFDAAVSVSDILAYASFADVMKEAVSRLAYNAGLSIDTVIRNAIYMSGTPALATGLTYAVATITAIPQTGVLSINEVKKRVRWLRANDVPEVDGGFYAAAVHPDSLYDMMVDSTTGGWIDAQKYTDNTPLLNGEVGKIAGVRFIESSNAGYPGQGSLAACGVVASSTLYVTPFFGKEAYGISELQGLKTYIKDFSSGGTSDPTDKVATAGWKCLFGVTVLNSGFYTNLIHAVTSTA